MTTRWDSTDLERFRKVLGRRLGFHLENVRSDVLAELLQQRLEATGIAQVESYLHRLEDPGSGREELRELATRLTVTESYFFRHPDQLRAFVERAVPERMHARSDVRQLRILSAGCASGEEPYSLVILLRTLVPESSDWDVAVHAIDVNPAMIEKARRARYSPWSLRETPPEIRERFFHSDASEFQLDESVRTAVCFEERNLLEDDPTYWRPECFDIVFCRNVIMYLSSEAAHVVIARLTESLAPGGFLFLGHAEALRGVASEPYELCHTHGSFYYKRRSCDGASQVPFVLPISSALESVSTVLSDGSWWRAIQRASDRIASLARGHQALFAACASKSTHGASDTDGSPSDHRTIGMEELLKLLSAERYLDALTLLSQLPPEVIARPDIQLLHGVLLTTTGELDRAEQICQQILLSDEHNVGAHYLMALCREHAGDDAGAMAHDRWAIAMDPTFAMPHLHLGLLARRSGDLETARRELRQALVLLEREEDTRIVLFGGGFKREALVQLCRAEYRACGGEL